VGCWLLLVLEKVLVFYEVLVAGTITTITTITTTVPVPAAPESRSIVESWVYIQKNICCAIYTDIYWQVFRQLK